MLSHWLAMTDRPSTPAHRAARAAKPRKRALIALLGGILVVAAAASLILVNEAGRRSDLSPTGLGSAPHTRIGAPFTLVDQTGQQRTSASFAGRKVVLVFSALESGAVTYGALQVLNAARELLGTAANDVSFVWITTDPVRDTPERLRQAVETVGGRWTAFTGPKAAVHTLARAYLVPDQLLFGSATRSDPAPAKGAPPAAAAIAYVLDEQGAFLSHRTVAPDPAAMAHWIMKNL